MRLSTILKVRSREAFNEAGLLSPVVQPTVSSCSRCGVLAVKVVVGTRIQLALSILVHSKSHSAERILSSADLSE